SGPDNDSGICAHRRETRISVNRITVGVAFDRVCGRQDPNTVCRSTSGIRVVRRIMRSLLVAASLALLTTPVSTQWLNHPTPGIPRTADGKPNLAAPAPRTPDGKPDFTGFVDRSKSVRPARKPSRNVGVGERRHAASRGGVFQDPSHVPVSSEWPRNL